MLLRYFKFEINYLTSDHYEKQILLFELDYVVILETIPSKNIVMFNQLNA